MRLTVNTKSTLDDSLNGVLVRIFDDGDDLVQGQESAAGKCQFDGVDAGTYTLWVSYANQPFEAPHPFAVTVAEGVDKTVTVKIALAVVPQSSNPLYCNCQGNINLPEGNESMALTLERIWPDVLIVNNAQVSNFPKPLRLDIVDNYGAISLLRKAKFNVRGPSGSQWQIQVPDALSADLGSVIFPVLKEVFPASVDVELVAEASEEVTYEEIYYSGLIQASADLVAGESLIRQFDSVNSVTSVVFVSSDTAVVRVSDSPGVLTLTAVGAGSATISASCENSLVHVKDQPEWADLISVTVT